MRRIVITGGTYAGKSSIVELFKKDRIKVVSDVGSEVIEELNFKLGQKWQREFRANNPVGFYSRIIEKQLEIENDLKSEIVVFDRGVHDYIAMLKLTGTAVPDSLVRLVEDVSYDIVFACDTLSDFNERKSSGRSLTKEDSLRLNELIKDIYQNLGCEVIAVKEMLLDQRHKFIRNRL